MISSDMMLYSSTARVALCEIVDHLDCARRAVKFQLYFLVWLLLGQMLEVGTDP